MRKTSDNLMAKIGSTEKAQPRQARSLKLKLRGLEGREVYSDELETGTSSHLHARRASDRRTLSLSLSHTQIHTHAQRERRREGGREGSRQKNGLPYLGALLAGWAPGPGRPCPAPAETPIPDLMTYYCLSSFSVSKLF